MSKHGGFKKLGTGLAGAIAIASGTSAYGTIITVSTPADLTNTPGGANTSVNWDVNGDAINDFTFTSRFPDTSPGDFGVIWQQNMNGIAATSGTLGYVGPFIRYAFALAAGANIGPGGDFQAGGQACLGSKYSYGAAGIYYYGGFAADDRTPGTIANGAVAPGTFAFAGFRFNAADGVHFGWIRLAVNAGLIDFANPIAAAYESTPNTAIAAGAVPEPGTMSLLALGAAGVLGAFIKRRRA